MNRLPFLLFLSLSLLGTVAAQEGRPIVTVLDEVTWPDEPGHSRVWDKVRSLVGDSIDLRVEALDYDGYQARSKELRDSPPDLQLVMPRDLEHFRGKDLRSLLGADYLSRFHSSIDQALPATIPSTFDVVSVLYVNRALLASLGLKPAATYEEWAAQARVLAAKGLEPLLMANRDDWVLQSCLFSLVCSRLGGPNFFEELKGGKERFDGQKFLSMLRFVRQLADDGILTPRSFETGYGEAPALFAQGRSPYYIDGSWRIGAFLTDPATKEALIPVPQQAGFDLMSVPTLPGQVWNVGATMVLGNQYGLNEVSEPGSSQEAAAVAVLKVLQGPEVQAMRAAQGFFPSRLDVAVADKEPLERKRTEFFRRQTASPVFDGEFPEPVFLLLNEKLRGVALGTMPPEEVGRLLQAAFDQTR